jgi:hypothetical protein
MVVNVAVGFGILGSDTYEAGLLVELNSLSALKQIPKGISYVGSIVLDSVVADS